MISHLTDLAKEFGALKSHSRCTRGGVEAQQAYQDVLLTYLATLRQQQQMEIDELRDLVNEMTSTVERLERRLNESCMSAETQLQELSIRLVRCYAIAQ